MSRLSAKQKSALHQALQELPATEVLDSLPALQNCPHCQVKAEHLAPWGWSRDLRRYRCRACRRTCSAVSSSGLARLHYPERWKDYAQALIDGLIDRETVLCSDGAAVYASFSRTQGITHTISPTRVLVSG
jgi:transposase-like protein